MTMSTDQTIYRADEQYLYRRGGRCPSSASRARSCARRWCSCRFSPAAPRSSSSRCSNRLPTRNSSCVRAPNPPSAYAVYVHLFQRYVCTWGPSQVHWALGVFGPLLTRMWTFESISIFLGFLIWNSQFGICCTQNIRWSSWRSWMERRFWCAYVTHAARRRLWLLMTSTRYSSLLYAHTLSCSTPTHCSIRRSTSWALFAAGSEHGIYARGGTGLHRGGGRRAGPHAGRGAGPRAHLLHTHVHAARRFWAHYGVALPRGA